MRKPEKRSEAGGLGTGFLREGNKARFVIAGEKCSGGERTKGGEEEKRDGTKKASEQVSSGLLSLFPLIDFLCSFLLPTLLILTYSLSQLVLIVSPSMPASLLSSSLDFTQSLPQASSLYTFSLSSHPFRALPLSLPSTVYSLSVLASFLSVLLYVKSPFLSMFISVSLHLFSASSLYLPYSDSPCPPLYFSAHQSDVPIFSFILLSCI